jgi:hypothetical protein
MREQLYHRLYERHESHGDKSHVREKSPVSTSHISYREALKELYVAILKFQATCFCFLSKMTGVRIAQDAVIWKDWNALFGEIEDKETKFGKIEYQWQDDQYELEYESERERHIDSLAQLGAIKEEINRVHKVIEKNRMDGQRESLLHWLSSVDPSSNYNSARKKHQSSTGDWLVLRNEEFRNWMQTENSLLWLNGKGGWIPSNTFVHLISDYI